MSMPNDNSGSEVPVFAPDDIIAISIGDLNVTKISTILFDVDQTIKIGSGSLTFAWDAGKPFGISPSVSSINLSATGNALVMVK